MLVDALAHIFLASDRTRRFYSLALSLAAAFILIATAAFWVESLQASYTDLQDRRATLANMERIIEAGSKSEATIAAADRAAQAVFLQGTSRAVVSASLQSWLSTVVQESEAQLQSIENSSLPEIDSKSYVGLSANIVGPWKAVQAVIFRIETAEPMLTIQAVDLQSYSYGAPADVEPSVTMRISIRGAVRDAGS